MESWDYDDGDDDGSGSRSRFFPAAASVDYLLRTHEYILTDFDAREEVRCRDPSKKGLLTIDVV